MYGARCLTLTAALVLLLADVTAAQEFSYLTHADICSEFTLGDDYLLVDDVTVSPPQVTFSQAAYDAVDGDDTSIQGRRGVALSPVGTVCRCAVSSRYRMSLCCLW